MYVLGDKYQASKLSRLAVQKNENILKRDEFRETFTINCEGIQADA